MTGLSLCPAPIRSAVPAVGLLALGLLVREPVGAEVAPADPCAGPGLASYATKPYATEEGRRRRCSLLQEIQTHGDLSSPILRDQVLEELSNRFAVTIDFTGSVGLPRQAIDYLLDNMPETAFLVSIYSGKEYRATQSDPAGGPKRFSVTNNDSFAAGFSYLSARIAKDVSEYMFFESGHAKVMLWRIWGNSFVHYQLRKSGDKASSYDIDIHVFTNSRILRVILNSRLFRYFSRSMFEGILEDIESAVREFAVDANAGDNLPPYFVEGLKTRL